MRINNSNTKNNLIRRNSGNVSTRMKGEEIPGNS